MSGGSAPSAADCPTCGEPVGAISSYCLYCEEALDDDGATVETAVVDFGASGAASDAAAGTTDDEEDGVEDAQGPAESDPPVDLVWFHVDSLPSSPRIAVSGVVAGLVVGSALRALLEVVTSGPLALLLGVVAGGGAFLYAIRAQSVYGAVRRSCLLIGALVVAAPAFLVTGTADYLGRRVVLFAITELAAVPIALLLVKFGRRIDAMAPDD